MNDVISSLPPQNTEAEEAVLGSCLMDFQAIDRVRGDLTPEHFYRSKNGDIYAAMLAISNRREPVDFVTLESELKATGVYEEIGGTVYLHDLIGVVPTAVHVEHYAGLVRIAALRRRLLSAAGRIAGAAYDESREMDDVLTYAVGELAKVQTDGGGMDVYSPEQQAVMFRDMVFSLGEGAPPGIPTGYYRLDWLTGGLRPGGLYVIGAPTGVGKTSWMGCVARNLRRSGKRVFFASCEMSVQELVKRNGAVLMGDDWNEIERRLAKPDDYPTVTERAGRAIEQMDGLAFHVYHAGGMTVDRIRRRALKMQADGGLHVVFVDYLQRLQPVETRGLTREQQVTQIAQGLKTMAMDLGIPVVAAVQFSRAWLNRDNKQPQTSDFRESGGIENEADLAIALFRKSKWDENADKEEAYLYVLKNRHGPEGGKTRLRWLAATAEYANPANERGQAED